MKKLLVLFVTIFIIFLVIPNEKILSCFGKDVTVQEQECLANEEVKEEPVIETPQTFEQTVNTNKIELTEDWVKSTGGKPSFKYDKNLDEIMKQCIEEPVFQKLKDTKIIVGYVDDEEYNVRAHNYTYPPTESHDEPYYVIVFNSDPGRREKDKGLEKQVILHELNHIYCAELGETSNHHDSKIWLENYNYIHDNFGIDIENN